MVKIGYRYLLIQHFLSKQNYIKDSNVHKKLKTESDITDFEIEKLSLRLHYKIYDGELYSFTHHARAITN